MIKKLLIASAILATSSTIAVASGAPYMGASVGVVTTTAPYSSFRGVPLTINAGYGAMVSQSIYLAGEVFGVVGTSTVTNNNQLGWSPRTTYGYGLSFIPGIMVSDHTMTYARLGVVKSRFSNSGSGIFKNVSSTETGTQVGLGMQTSLTQNWDLRGEYDYTKYKNTKSSSPQSDAFNIGFIYKFE